MKNENRENLKLNLNSQNLIECGTIKKDHNIPIRNKYV